ncbi:MAG: transglycosylase domain-containing protein, partial [Hyphomicrobiaceae bacterium]
MAIIRMMAGGLLFNVKLGPLRHVFVAGFGYLVFALVLVYVIAPIRGFVGQRTMADQLRYASERWLATAVYDAGGSFVGTYDGRADSMKDVNYTDAAISVGEYVANPDHKSIPVRVVPDSYWQCLSWHEDRYIGGWLNPAGIDLVGVLKIPYTSVARTLQTRRPHLGVGGSTLPMQFARVIYKTPPSSNEGSMTKLRRKLSEWWLAPVIYHTLTKGGDDTPLKQWAANHIWLAQRTGGQPLHGIEVTSQIVFGKEASELSTAEQFVLASAVNKPIILLTGSDQLNAVRMDRWRYITEVRARTCAEKLIKDPAEQAKVLFELVQMASGPPDPRVKPKMLQALETYAPSLAKRAQANPNIRMTALMPTARFGIREEMKLAYGFQWRDYVRGVTTTLDTTENLSFNDKIKVELSKIDAREQTKINTGFTLDPMKLAVDRKMPHVVVVAANAKGEIVRYFEAGETAPYFGSPMARDSGTGRYVRSREGRQIASTGKILAAIGIANEHRDLAGTLYHDPAASARGQETCERGDGTVAGTRKALVSFACSLNKPLEWRTARLGQQRVGALIDGFGFNLPPGDANGDGVPPSTAAVRGLVGGSPRRVHHMASVVLASLIDKGGTPVKAPSLVKAFDYTNMDAALAAD